MQAPLGPAATRELVVAVSNAGALGTLAAAWNPRMTFAKRSDGFELRR